MVFVKNKSHVRPESFAFRREVSDINGFLLLIPVFLIRYGFLFFINKDAMKRAAYFAPMVGKERYAYWIYQLSTVAILVYMFFLKVKTEPSWSYCTGLIIYGAGILLCAVSVVNFAFPTNGGINRNGLYRFSRNPMYMAFLVCFLGCVSLTQSLILLGLVIIFQIAAHWIILAEERWCIAKFGEEYQQYMKKVRRYI